MRRTLAIIIGCLLMAIPGVAQSKNDQDKKTDKTTTSRAQIVGTAEITKVDEKKKLIQVRNVVESANNSSTTDDDSGPRVNRRGGYPGGGYPGGGYPGGGRRGPGGYPGSGYPGGGYPGGGGGRYPGGGQPNSSQTKEYKVYVTKDTILKLEDQDMEFKDMHVGDRIIVAGTPKGNGADLEATTITRKF